MTIMSALIALLCIATAWAQPPSGGSDSDRPDSKSSGDGPPDSKSGGDSGDGAPPGDVGCNYVNVGGVGMPVDYCSRVTYQGAYVSMLWKCNDSYTGIDMEMYFASNCDGEPLVTQDYTAC